MWRNGSTMEVYHIGSMEEVSIRTLVDTIAQAIGAKVVVADPLAANWAENLKRVASEFSQALR